MPTFKHIPMKIFKMTNDNYKRIRHVLDGWAFHRPLGETHHEMKFITRKAQKDILAIFDKNRIEYEDTGRTE